MFGYETLQVPMRKCFERSRLTITQNIVRILVSVATPYTLIHISIYSELYNKPFCISSFILAQ